jgi:hypothetical protein
MSAPSSSTCFAACAGLTDPPSSTAEPRSVTRSRACSRIQRGDRERSKLIQAILRRWGVLLISKDALGPRRAPKRDERQQNARKPSTRRIRQTCGQRMSTSNVMFLTMKAIETSRVVLSARLPPMPSAACARIAPKDQANLRPARRPKKESVSNDESDRNNSRPVGTTTSTRTECCG